MTVYCTVTVDRVETSTDGTMFNSDIIQTHVPTDRQTDRQID